MTAPAVPPDATAVKKSGGKERSSSNVRVVGRIRPLAEYEKEKGCEEVLRCLPSDPVTGNGTSEVIQIEGKDKRWFELDAVFDGNSTQDEVYIKSGAKQAVTEDIFQGFNCTILAYGQTGAGKIAVGGGENCQCFLFIVALVLNSYRVIFHTRIGKTFTMGTAAGGRTVSETDGIIPRA